jgi:hypothetical protein
MRPHLRYLGYVLRHKWWVFVAGLYVGAPLWRLLIHDWSKFLPSEWFAYVRHFYTEVAPRSDEPLGRALISRNAKRAAAFDAAWNRHQKRNPHHWQFWLLTEDRPPAARFELHTESGGARRLTSIRDNGSVLSAREYLRSYVEPGSDCLVTRLVAAANRSRPLPMPEKFVREMVADWMGAGRAITGRWDVQEWYATHREQIVLHPATRHRVEAILAKVG